MVKYSFVFFIFFLIAILSILSANNAFIVVPGWHTTIYPKGFIVEIIQTIWLGVASLIYFLLEKKRRTVSKKIFISHTLLSLFFFAHTAHLLFENLLMINIASVATYILYGIGQCVFVYGVIKAKK